MSENIDYKLLEKKAEEIRRKSIEMIVNAKSGHVASTLSCVDILVALYYSVATEEDIIILSKGHAAPALYTILIDKGIISKEQFKYLRHIHGILEGHPCVDIPGVEASTGSLGVGFSVAVGRAFARKIRGKPGIVYCIIGDGEMQEGICWELFGIAFHHRLDNLIVIVDRNGLQLSGATENILCLEPIERKLKSFNWVVRRIDGHNIRKIVGTIDKIKDIEGFPKIIIADTVKGKGVEEMEWNVAGHSMKAEEVEKFIKGLWEE